VHQGKIGSNVIRQVLTEMQRTGGDPDPIIENLGLAQVSNENELEEVIAHVISENPDVVEKIKAGKEAGLQYLMGQVMAKTQGKANPGIVIELLKKNIQ
jgi:aspartyl-tRNA(Asn)/glutamyl-tRNA(Gln) amidotransferase subunit B